MYLNILSKTLNILALISDISSIITSYNFLYQHVSLFNEFNDKFGTLNKDCWIGMFNVKCIVKPSILKAILPIDAISKALVFVKSKYMFLLYNCNDPWIMNFNVIFLLIPTPPIKNKHIGLASIIIFMHNIININLCSSFNCLSKLRYSNFQYFYIYYNLQT